ncbi:MAG: HTH domain-containing protein [Planctomycetes bacterium]|nr:HTH domain-containing protein [Planctomycetota bacterium]
MATQRLGRAIEMLSLLESNQTVSANYLAEVLQCSRRTIFRDLSLLRDAGIDIQFDETSESYCAHSEMKSVNGMGETELIAIVLAAWASPIAHLPQFQASIQQGVSKLLAQVPEDVRIKVYNLARALRVQSATPEALSTPPKFLAILLDATVQRRCVHVCYSDNKQTARQTKLWPYVICAAMDEWRLIARSAWHKAVVDVSISQITNAKLLDETFLMPRRFLRAESTWAKTAGPK